MVVGLNVWPSYYTVPSDFVSVVQRFRLSFCLKFEPDETLRHVSESVMRGVISDRTVGALLKRQESFNEVNQTQQPKKRLINEARREYNKIILSAEAENEQGIQEADGWRRYVDQE